MKARPAPEPAAGASARRGRTPRVAAAVLRWSAMLVATFALAAGAGFAVATAACTGDLPGVSDLRENYRPRQSNRFYASDGTLIGETYAERRSVVPMSEVPRDVVSAVLGAEDAEFFKHKGLDYPGILRALWINVRKGRAAQGASTITQQVVRTFYLGREKTASRKFKELLLARRLEQNLSKEEILFLYLNQIYFGHGRYGIQEASRYYLGKDVKDVDLAGAALLAGLPKGPEIYSPFKNHAKASTRRDWVLDMMAEQGLADRARTDAAKLVPVPDQPPPGPDQDLGPEFVDEAQKLLVSLVGADEAALGGYQVWTTMSVEAQRAARSAVDEGLSRVDGRHGYRGPIVPRGKKGKPKTCEESPHGIAIGPKAAPVAGKIYEGMVEGADDAHGLLLVRVGSVLGAVPVAGDARYNPKGLAPSGFAQAGCKIRVSLLSGEVATREGKLPRLGMELGPQAALVALDPATREIVALVGGQGYGRGGFDRAIRGLRQPGSAFKPFVYLEAIRSRLFTAATMLDDAPVSYDEYKPENYETWKFTGPIRLRPALAQSVNVVAIRLVEKVGAAEVAALAASMGISSKLDPVLGIALGASSVKPVELLDAYATLASGGVRYEHVLVRRIADPWGRDVKLPERAAPERVVEEPEAWILTDMLRSVVDDTDGTGKLARKLGLPAAGKTGTSDQARDAWFVGWTPQLLAVVWVGFDDMKSIGPKEAGGKTAVPIWTAFMKDALRGKPEADFPPPPPGVASALVDPASGLLAWDGQPDAISEWFLEGTEPVEKAIPPGVQTPEGFLMEEGFDDAAAGAAPAPVVIGD